MGVVGSVTAHPVLSVTEVSRRSGFAASALRFYEERGLISASRSAAGRRQYERGVLRRLAFIRAASNVGLTLDEIAAELATLPTGRTPTKADWQRLSTHWRSRLNEQIAALEQLRDGLDSCIGCGCLSLSRCRISNPDDSAGGVGARFLPRALRARPGGR